MERLPFPFRGLIIVFGLVALLFPIALLGQLELVGRINAVISEVARIRQAQLLTAALERAQLDEETAIRGYAASNQSVFLEPYERGLVEFPSDFRAVRERVTDPTARLGPDDAAVAALADRVAATNGVWLATVARPIVRGVRSNGIELAGMRLVDQVRSDVALIDQHLAVLYTRWSSDRDRTVRIAQRLGDIAGGLIVFELVIFVYILLRMRNELDRERAAVETLQNALVNRVRAHPALDVGSVYFSATRGARIGGDMYDVYRLDGESALIVIGDVSGKGIEAAVDAALIRYGLRAQVAETRDPAQIVSQFNRLYMSDRQPEAFVALFVGIYDAASGELRYTNAGHEAAYVRRAASVEWLRPTDSLVGIDADAVFTSTSTTIRGDETLVLATDGLTEARNPSHTFLPNGEVERWIIDAPNTSAQALVDAILRRVQRWTRYRHADDLAILAVRRRNPVIAKVLR